MNRIYRVIFDRRLGRACVASELARGGRGSSSGSATRRVGPALALLLGAAALQWHAGTALAACSPAAPVDGDAVSCTGVPILLPPNPNSFLSNANDLVVTVQSGAIMSTLPGGTAMTFGGSKLTLNNHGAIDANAAGSLVIARGLAIGNLAAPLAGAIVVNNHGTIEGTFDGTFGLQGAAMVIANAGGGITGITNSGTIGVAPLGLFDPVNGIAIGAYGGGNVSFVNTGTITGRVAFSSPTAGGNSFINDGTINGSVSLGTTVANDSFTAVTGSVVNGALVPLPGVAVPTPAGPPLTYASGGTVDAGIGGQDTLVLQNVLAGPGSGSGGAGTVSALQYLNFENLVVNSGTWALGGAVVSGSATFNGGTAVFDSALAFGTGTLTGNGGAIAAASKGLTLAQGVSLTGGLIVQGSNDMTLSGTVTGSGGLIKNGSGTLSLTGSNDFSGGLALNGGGLTLGHANALGNGLFLVGGPATLNTAFTGTLANPVQLNNTLTLQGNGSLTLAGHIAGGGSLTLASGNLALTGANAYAGGTVIAGGAIDVGNGTALGSGALTVNGAATLTGAAGVALGNTLVLNDTLAFGAGGSGGALTLNGPVTGKGGMTLTGGSGLTLNGSNDFAGGFNLGKGAALTVGSSSALGIGVVTVSGAASLTANKAVSLANMFNLNAQLGVDGASDLTLDGTLGGLGGLVKSGTGTLTLTGTNSYFGGTTVAGGTLLVSNASGSATGYGLVAVESGGRLAGSGRVGGDVVVDAGGTLAPGAGAVAMGTLAVGGDLLLQAGSKLDFQFGAPGADFSTPGQGDSVSVAGELSIAPGTTLDVTDAGAFGPGVYRLFDYGTLAAGSALTIGSAPLGSTLSILDHTADKRLMLANTAGLTLNFWNANGLASPAQAGGGSGIWRTTSPVWTDAKGTISAPMQPQPGFAIFGGAPGTVTVDGNDGPVAATGLQFASGGYTLAGDALTLTGTGGVAAEVRVGDGSAASAGFTATLGNTIAGNAGLAKTGAGTLVLSGSNTYTGGTSVQGGTLSVSADANLGAAGGGVSIDGARLRVTGTGFTATARSIGIGAAGAEIETTDAGLSLTANGALSGSGPLRKTGAGTLTLAGAGSSYTGTTTVAAGTLRMGADAVLPATARVTLADQAGATLDLDAFDQTIGSLTGGGSAGGELRLGSATLATGGDGSSTAFGGTVTGAGSLVKQGSGTFTLDGAASHAGSTQVAAGTLRTGAAGVLSAASAHTVAAGATLALGGFSQTVGALANNGTVSLVGSAPGTTLTVRGAYAGGNGVLRLGSVLGAGGTSDRLVLDGTGASASGRTTVQIANLGGLGALTSGNGIEVVSALNGATTTAQTTKDAFALAGGHVDAGAYEYRLHAADANGAGENWYLRSTLPGTDGGGGNGGGGGADPGTPPPVPSPTPAPTPTYRVEVPLYAALPQQLRQGNLAMLGSLAVRGGDRVPSQEFNDAGESVQAAASHRRQAWGRVISTDLDLAQPGTVGARSDGRMHGFQAGTDLVAGANWRAGVYVGQLEGDARVSGHARGLAGLQVGGNDLRSRYLGAYATWYGDSGWYADIALQAGDHRYTVQPLASLGSAGKGKSTVASIELGKAFDVGGGWRVEPQLQFIHQHLSLDASALPGAWVTQQPDDGLVVRAGLQVKGEIATAAGRLQPYGRLNVFHASGGGDVAHFHSLGGSTAIWSETGATSTELAGGMTLAVSERTSVYGEIGKLWASGGGARVKSALNASLGVRVRW